MSEMSALGKLHKMMTSAGLMGTRSRRFGQIFLCLFNAALLTASVETFLEDREGRQSAQQFVVRYDVRLRRPEIARTVEYVPAPDWAAEVVGDVALRDASEPINLTNATPALRAAWIAAAATTDDELLAAGPALLNAIRARPGWPFYQSMLGEVTFTLQSRQFSPDLVRKSAMWARPLLYAARGAPAAAATWRSLAAAYLRTWPVLSGIHAATSHEVFTHAFADPYFVYNGFADAARLLGEDEAIAYLPEVPADLQVAFDYFAAKDDTAKAWPLFVRWERAEWNARERDLLAIRVALRENDLPRTETACNRWTSDHIAWSFDTPAARAQAAELVEQCSGTRGGSWSSHPLADVIRYLLTRDEADRGVVAAVDRSIGLFSDVPAATIAEIKVASGDISGAERIAWTAEDRAAPVWARYNLILAKHYFDHGQEAEANAVLERFNQSAVNGPADVRSQPAAPTPENCGPKIEVTLHASKKRIAMAHLTTGSPAIVDLTVDGARAKTVLVNGEADIPLTLTDWRERTLIARPVAGDRNTCLSISYP